MKQSEKQSIAEKARAFVANQGSQNRAAAVIGISGATLSQILNGNWELISEEMWRTVGAKVGYDPRQWVIVQTDGYNRMYDLLSDAQENALVFAVTGDAGCGKTQAIREYAARNSNVVVLSCSEFWNRKQFLGELLAALGIDPAGLTIGEMVSEAVRTLKRREGVLIVIDEADKLSDQPLLFFITLYNQLEDHCGIILCATQHLEKKILSGVRRNKRGYREIYSRISRRFIPMPLVSEAEIEAVCIANGITNKKTIANIAEDCDGDLRRVKKLVHGAKRLVVESSNAD